MRRVDRELSRDEAMRLLTEAKYGTLCLGMGPGGYPCAVPINCAVVDDMLVFHGAKVGEKQDVIARDGHATFVAVLNYAPVRETYSAKYESVIVRGIVRGVEDDAERIRLLSAFTAKVLDVSEAEIRDDLMKMQAPTRVLAMSIDEVTGKRSPKA